MDYSSLLNPASNPQDIGVPTNLEPAVEQSVLGPITRPGGFFGFRNSMFSPAQSGIGSSVFAPCVSVRRNNSSQTIPNNTDTTVVFDTTYELVGIVANAAMSAFTIQLDGHYFVSLTGDFALNATGIRNLGALLPRVPTDNPTLACQNNGSTGATLSISGLAFLKRGDSVSLNAFQTSGGDLGLNGPQMGVHWIGP